MRRNVVQTLTVNSLGRDFVVGDVHGYWQPLRELLDHVRFDAGRDRLICLGDLVDRGPDSEAVVRAFMNQPAFLSLFGNHEHMACEALRHPHAARQWLRLGGAWGGFITEREHREIADYMSRLPIAVELPLPDGRRIGMVHAEVKPGLSWQQLRDRLGEEDVWVRALYSRDRVLDVELVLSGRDIDTLAPDRLAGIRRSFDGVPGIDLVLHGHNITPGCQPLQVANVLYLDTGSFLPEGLLTLYEPLTGRFWQAGCNERRGVIHGEARTDVRRVELPAAARKHAGP